MNVLVDTNISQSQLLNAHPHDNVDQSDNGNENNNSILHRIVQWFHLAKRWKEKSPLSEVCKYKCIYLDEFFL